MDVAVRVQVDRLAADQLGETLNLSLDLLAARDGVCQVDEWAAVGVGRGRRGVPPTAPA
jgi:hypothetical protein